MRRSRFLGGLASAAAWLSVGAPVFASEGLDLDTPQQNVAIRVFLHGERSGRYRGRLDALDLPDGRSGMLNTLNLEEYLYGVLPAEIPSSWPYAALEAQAILARTFAMKRRNPKHAFDVVAGSADQEYRGIIAEALASNAAIDACAGMVVLYNALPASVAYMTCCGGHTENAQRVWGMAYPYLGGVSDPYCAAAPKRSWSVRVPWARFARESGLRGAPEHAVLDDVGAGGRPGSVRFIGSGEEGTISTLRLRSLSGWRLPSTFIRSVSIERNGMPMAEVPQAVTAPATIPAMIPSGFRPMHEQDDVGDDLNRGGGDDDDDATHGAHWRSDTADSIVLLFQGLGSGHGVGLCQWGAHGMAVAGATAQEIVAHYLPSTHLGPAITRLS